MKAITVRQPWAWGLIHGAKRIENRTWATSFRGRLAIHAGLSWAAIDGTQPSDWAELFPDLPPWPQLVFGAIIGTVEVYDCVPLASAPPGPFTLGPVCWLVRDPIPLKRPFPCPGKPGLFEVQVPGYRMPRALAAR